MRKLTFRFPKLIFLLSGLLGCTDLALEIKTSRDVQTDPAAIPTATGSNDYAWYPDPGRKGPYDVCKEWYTLPYSEENHINWSGGAWKNGRIYFPKDKSSSGEDCRIVNARFPLVVILPADGHELNSGIGTYDILAEHISSHGFIVQIYHRDGITGWEPEVGQRLFYLHTKHAFESKNILSGGENLGSYMNHDLAIIGHSAGGTTITKLLGGTYDPGKPGIYGAGFNLKAVVLMSPTVYPELADEDVDLSPHVPSLLGISVATDGDMNAYGDKTQGMTMKSVFKYFDDFQLQQNQLFNKEMLFIGQVFSHYYQWSDFAKSYITSYLRRELNGEIDQNKYFKYQNKPSIIDPLFDIRQLSLSGAYQVLADFENQSLQNGTSNTIALDYNNIDHSLYYSIDDLYSPHNTYCVKLIWDNQQNDNPWFQVLNSNGIDAKSKFLSFTVSQQYTGDANMSDVDFRISLIDDANSTSNSINISTFGGLLLSPVILQNHQITVGSADATKNAMRSYRIPFSAFNGIDLTQIEIIKFEFNDPNYPTGRIILDNISITD